MSDLVPKEHLGPAMGLFRTINDAGLFMGPLVLGSIAGVTLNGNELTFVPFAVGGIFLFVIAAALVRTKDPVAEGKIAPPKKAGP
jgi:MFS-type transporter involved in bile tolerance (Atg22 family)